jgi:hypothetical protein
MDRLGDHAALPFLINSSFSRRNQAYICGGCRARAYAVTGDPLAEDPACGYIPVKRRRAFDS